MKIERYAASLQLCAHSFVYWESKRRYLRVKVSLSNLEISFVVPQLIIFLKNLQPSMVIVMIVRDWRIWRCSECRMDSRCWIGHVLVVTQLDLVTWQAWDRGAAILLEISHVARCTRCSGYLVSLLWLPKSTVWGLVILVLSIHILTDNIF